MGLFDSKADGNCDGLGVASVVTEVFTLRNWNCLPFTLLGEQVLEGSQELCSNV